VGVDASGNAPGGQVDLQVYACRPGRVEGVLVAGEPRAVEIVRNGVRYGRVDLAAGVPKEVNVPVQAPRPFGQRLCTIGLRGTGGFSVPRLAFSPR
jgi:hypothetical protein